MINVHIMNNPYKTEPYKTLWQKGHRRAKQNYEQARLARERKEALDEGVPVAKTTTAPTPTPTPKSVPLLPRPFTPKPTTFRPTNPKPKPKPKPDARPVTYRPGTIGAYLGKGTVADLKRER